MDEAIKMPGHKDVRDERRLREATDAGGIALWSWNVDTGQISIDERAFEIWRLPQTDVRILQGDDQGTRGKPSAIAVSPPGRAGPTFVAIR